MIYLALKQLFSKKMQSVLILLGIGFGTMLFISISAVQLGFREYMVNALLNNTAHILISGNENLVDKNQIQKKIFKDQIVNWIVPPSGKKDESKLNNYQAWVTILKNDKEVFDFSPRLKANAILRKGSIKTNVSLLGTIPDKQMRVGNIHDYIYEGNFMNIQNAGNKIILGVGVLKDLGLRIGQFVDVVTGLNEVTPFKVVASIKLGDQRLDKSMAIAHLTDVQKVNKTPGRISEIAVALFDIDKAQDLASLWKTYSNDKVEDWKQANKMFMEMIKMQDVVRYFIMFAVLIVAAFGIYNVLSIMINQKKKEIAILRSIGYGPPKILELILYQGVFLGFLGGIIGIVLGFLVTYIIGSLDLGFELGKSNHMMVSYDSSIYYVAFIAAIIASIVASFIPALLASRLSPIDIIRES